MEVEGEAIGVRTGTGAQTGTGPISWVHCAEFQCLRLLTVAKFRQAFNQRITHNIEFG